MVVPKKKTSRSRRNQRRAHDFLVPKGFSICKETGEVVPPHRVSLWVGTKEKRFSKLKLNVKLSSIFTFL
jgi:large subunit ribosomal protein L32